MCFICAVTSEGGRSFCAILAALAALAALLLSGSAAHGCGDDGSSRLKLRCMVDRAAGKALGPRSAQILDHALKVEGYRAGLGFAGQVPDLTSGSRITPLVTWSDNINGGNAHRPLVIGSLTFTGNPDNLKQSGIVGGAEWAGNARYLLGPGRYFDGGASASYVHSPNHGTGIVNLAGTLCAKLQIARWTYADMCGTAQYNDRKLAGSHTFALDLAGARIFATAHGTHEVRLGVRRIALDEYGQFQLFTRLSSLHDGHVTSSIDMTFAPKVSGHLANRLTIGARLGTQIAGHRLRFSLGAGFAEGGTFLGEARRRRTLVAGVDYRVTQNLEVEFGYRVVESAIDWFSASAPFLGFRFTR